MKELNKKQSFYQNIKTFNAFIGILLFLPFIVPLFIIVLLINVVATKGHPFYSQIRFGYKRKQFNIYKFRSMSEDGSVTSWGKFIRYTSLDELPQFINILKLDMVLIGPRPLSILESDMDEARTKATPSPYLVKPGLTGYAQTRFSYEAPIEIKVANDSYYVEHFSLLLDIKIFLITLFKAVPITIHKK